MEWKKRWSPCSVLSLHWYPGEDGCFLTAEQWLVLKISTGIFLIPSLLGEVEVPCDYFLQCFNWYYMKRLWKPYFPAWPLLPSPWHFSRKGKRVGGYSLIMVKVQAPFHSLHWLHGGGIGWNSWLPTQFPPTLSQHGRGWAGWGTLLQLGEFTSLGSPLGLG